ncbi:MAG: hypothetical protein K6B44_09755 [Lachnospiraceae bacterium]|nr:hypothetical protein [Lachnospiraceae bacterium]
MPKITEMNATDLSYALRRGFERSDKKGKIELAMDVMGILNGDPELEKKNPEQHKALTEFIKSLFRRKDRNGKLDGNAVNDFISDLNDYQMELTEEYSTMLDGDLTEEAVGKRVQLDQLSELFNLASMEADSDPLFAEWNEAHPDERLTTASIRENIKQDLDRKNAAIPGDAWEPIGAIPSKEKAAYVKAGMMQDEQAAAFRARKAAADVAGHMDRLEAATADILTDPFERMVRMAEEGHYRQVVEQFVDLNFKVAKGSATPEETRTLRAFEEYASKVASKDDARGIYIPERSTAFISHFLEEMALYRAELIVESGRIYDQHAADIRNGRVPGTEAYRNNETAIRDLAGNMMNNSDAYLKATIAANGISMLVIPFDATEVSPDIIERLELKSPLIGDFKTQLSKMTEEYGKSLQMPGQRSFDHGSISMPDSVLEGKYGIKLQGNAFVIPEGPEAEANAHELEGKSAKRGLRAVDAYIHNRDAAKEIARVQLQAMQEMISKSRNNSKEFMDLMYALGDVAIIDDNDSPHLVQERLQTLKEASEAYMERIDGSIFRGVRADGRARRELAGNLAEFATAQMDTLEKLIDGGVNEFKPVRAQRTRLEVDDLYNDLTKHEAELQSAAPAVAAEPESPRHQITYGQTAPEVQHIAMEETLHIPEPQQGVRIGVDGKHQITYGQTEPQVMHVAETTAPQQPQQASVIPEDPRRQITYGQTEPQVQHAIREESVQQPKRARVTNIGNLMREQREAEGRPAEKNSVREEVLRKREAIMQKRRENEAAGKVSDGKNQLQQGMKK